MNTIEQLRKWCGGTWVVCADETAEIDLLITDTRNIERVEGALFIALKTPLRNGHVFVLDAYEKGIRNFIVTEEVNLPIPGANIVNVTDTLNALQQITAAHRRQYHVPVIGITGSNGKTIVKEWLYQLLGSRYHTVRSPRSYNSQLGVPLSVWDMDNTHQLGIFEAGISQPGEMERLEKIIQPTIGIFTNAGEAHSEGFLNQRQKINEKLMLFRHVQHLVYCRDHADVNECVVQSLQHIKASPADMPVQLFTWSARQDANVRITSIKRQSNSTTITAIHNGNESDITIPFTDEASVENAMHCWCVAMILKVPDADVAKAMSSLQPVSMRLELRQGINDCTIINDAYNSDLTSLLLALTYLDQQKQHKLHTVIMSDMLQVGRRDLDLYDDVAEQISKRNIQRFIGIGPALYKNKASFRKYKKLRSIFFKSTEDLLKNFHLLTFNREAILLKGARVFAFEKIAMLLEHQVHQTVMSVDLGALRKNLDTYRSQLSREVKTMVMVKAFAYGSGSYEIANLLQQAGIDYLAVAYTDEGITLRRAGITLPIMVMSPDSASFDRMIAWKLEPEIFNFRSLAMFTTIADTLQVKNYPIHIKLDTGMHRLGFHERDIAELSSLLKDDGRFRVASVFSHLAASDDPAEDAFTAQQAHQFDAMSTQLTQALGYAPLKHLCNSAGIARHNHLQYNMVRLGLGLYGVDSSHELDGALEQISVLKTMIAQVMDVAPGENIGYGHKTIAQHPMRTATICIGYADGYMRSLGNGRAHVLINGLPAKTVGNICMDMCMVDVTDIPDVMEGDEAIVFGPGLPVTQLAQWAGTISYEIMTGIAQRVKRVYINE